MIVVEVKQGRMYNSIQTLIFHIATGHRSSIQNTNVFHLQFSAPKILERDFIKFYPNFVRFGGGNLSPKSLILWRPTYVFEYMYNYLIIGVFDKLL